MEAPGRQRGSFTLAMMGNEHTTGGFWDIHFAYDLLYPAFEWV